LRLLENRDGSPIAPINATPQIRFTSRNAICRKPASTDSRSSTGSSTLAWISGASDRPVLAVDSY
jgi:hypothetical protein